MKKVTLLEQMDAQRLMSGQPIVVGKETIMMNGRKPLARATKHWTQTPTGRAKAVKFLRKASRVAARNRRKAS